MPGPTWPNNSPLLSGLFGVLQSTSAAFTDTAGTWSALRQAAGAWQWQSQGLGPLPDGDVLESNGQEILRSQGVGIQQVNTYRAIANSWRSAKANLHAQDLDEQIRATSIFQPPWAQTAATGVPSRYRARIEWEVTPQDGDPFFTWGTYELDSPITTMNDVLAQANGLVARKPTSNMPLGAQVTDVNDYEIEQI